MLYRQGSDEPDRQLARRDARRRPSVKAIALRVRDAGQAWRARARPRRLGDADARLGDGAQHPRHPRRRRQPDLLRRPLPGLLDLRRRFRLRARTPSRKPPALAGLHWFGVVQAILRRPHRATGSTSTAACSASRCCREGQYFGVLPKGTLLESPCHKFYLQLIEPPPGAEDIHWDEGLVRVGLGAPDVPAATQARCRSAAWCSSTTAPVQPSDKGALTQVYLGGVTFELVVSHLASRMNLDHFGMDTITLAGPLEAQAARDARRRLHPGHAERHRHRRPSRRRAGGDRRRCARAACASPASRCCATSRACRATCTPTRSTSPRRCSRCATRSARACCSRARPPRRTPPATPALLTKDLQKLAMLAVPLGIRIAYEALSWGRHVNEYPQAWDIVAEADRANLGLALDSFHILATRHRASSALEEIDPREDLPGAALRLHVAEMRSREERIDTARHFRVFPGEGVHSDEVARAGAHARRPRLPRRLQLRGVQRRLHAAAAARWSPSARGAR